MADAFAEVEAAIAELTKTRQLVSRQGSKQIRSTDQVDHLKSVADAWFQTHRPPVARHSSHPDLGPADTAYQAVMDATGRHAARTTYLRALREAKRALIAVRSLVAAMPNNSPQPASTGLAAPPGDVAPAFTPLAADPKMQTILNRRWVVVQQCVSSRSYLAATVIDRKSVVQGRQGFQRD